MQDSEVAHKPQGLCFCVGSAANIACGAAIPIDDDGRDTNVNKATSVRYTFTNKSERAFAAAGKRFAKAVGLEMDEEEIECFPMEAFARFNDTTSRTFNDVIAALTAAINNKTLKAA